MITYKRPFNDTISVSGLDASVHYKFPLNWISTKPDFLDCMGVL